MVLYWGKLHFLSVVAVILHCSHIWWRYYLTNGISDGDSVNLHMPFWLVFSEISIMLQSGINKHPLLPKVSKEWGWMLVNPCGVSECLCELLLRTGEF